MNVDLVRQMIVRQGREVIDQVERGAILAGEMEAVPLDPHDQISLAAAVLEEPVPRLGAAVVAVADAHLAHDRRAVGQGFAVVGRAEILRLDRGVGRDADVRGVEAIAGLDPGARPETFPPEAFNALAQKIVRSPPNL